MYKRIGSFLIVKVAGKKLLALRRLRREGGASQIGQADLDRKPFHQLFHDKSGKLAVRFRPCFQKLVQSVIRLVIHRIIKIILLLQRPYAAQFLAEYK